MSRKRLDILNECGKYYQNFGNICWFTNFDHHKRHYPLELYREYYNKGCKKQKGKQS